MMRSGAQQVEAMKISGHKTTSVFMRYNIVDEDETVAVMKRVEKFFPVKVQRALPSRRKAHG
jgi:hypothetical protein